jgi:hypothetical protein
MSSSDTLLITISSALGIGVSILLYVALLVVALTVVRKANSTASGLLAGAAGVSLVAVVLSPIAHMGASRAGEPSDTIVIIAVLNLALMLVRAAGFVLLIVGIAKLATGAAGEKPLSPLIPH